MTALSQAASPAWPCSLAPLFETSPIQLPTGIVLVPWQTWTGNPSDSQGGLDGTTGEMCVLAFDPTAFAGTAWSQFASNITDPPGLASQGMESGGLTFLRPNGTITAVWGMYSGATTWFTQIGYPSENDDSYTWEEPQASEFTQISGRITSRWPCSRTVRTCTRTRERYLTRTINRADALWVSFDGWRDGGPTRLSWRSGENDGEGCILQLHRRDRVLG